MLYIRGEREGDFGLHLLVCRNMIPYFFASGHWNYARDSIVYLRGEHVVYLKDGLFNGVWSDMAIESTYTEVGKGLDGIVGVTTNKRSIAIW